MYILIDNQAAIAVLNHNPDGVAEAYSACEKAAYLYAKGWSLKSVWTPSHCGIEGNERADSLAKAGSNSAVECKHAYTSKTWMLRQAKNRFHKEWSKELNLDRITWSYPEEWRKWTFKRAKAFFRIYCGRSYSDPLPGQDPVRCQCNDSDLSSDHLLGQCTLFERSRYLLLKGTANTPILTKELILDRTWGPATRTLAQKIGLGFKEELNWDADCNDNEPSEEQNEHLDETELEDDWDADPFLRT